MENKEIRDTEVVTEDVENAEDSGVTENTEAKEESAGKPSKAHRYWIFSLILILAGGGLNLWLKFFLAGWDKCLQIGPISTDMLVKGAAMVWTIGLLSLPAFIYDDFKKKKTIGWVVVGVLMAGFLALSVVLTMKSDRDLLGPYNLGYKGYHHDDLYYVISTENDYLGNTYYIYWIRSGMFTYTQTYTTYLSETEEWREDCLFLMNFDDTYVLIPYDLFYGYNPSK